jgi:O-antigen/teichoic acid export membrane protein
MALRRLLTEWIQKLRSKLFTTDFASNVGLLTGATVAGRAILVLATPLLTRLYSPEDFDLLAVYMSLLSILTVIAAFRFDIAVPIPKIDDDSFSLLALALLISSLFSLLLCLIIVIFPAAIATTLGRQNISEFLWMVPAGVFFGASYQALQYWASRKRRYRLVAYTRISRAAGGAGAQLGLGAAGFTSLGLVFGHFIYTAIGTFTLILHVWKKDHNLLHGLSCSSMLQQFRAYWRFPVYSVPEALFNSAGTQLPVLIIAANSKVAEAGFLLIAMQVMTTPLALIGRSVGQVFLTEAAERHRVGSLSQFTLEMAWKLFKYSALPLCIVGVSAPFVFPLIFGEAWVRAGTIVMWMTPWVILQFVSSPISTVLHATGRLSTALQLQTLGLFIRVGATLIAVQLTSQMITETYALSSAVFYAVYLLALIRTTR